MFTVKSCIDDGAGIISIPIPMTGGPQPPVGAGDDGVVDFGQPGTMTRQTRECGETRLEFRLDANRPRTQFDHWRQGIDCTLPRTGSPVRCDGPN